MVHFIVSSIAYLSNSQLPARSYLWLVEHKNRSCLWSLQSHAGNCAEPLPGPTRDRSSCGFHMPAKGQVFGTVFGTGCQGEREKLAGALPSTGEGIKEQYTWGMARGTESLASPHIHIIEPVGTTTALNGGDSGCCALNHTISVHRWGRMELILPLASLTGWFPPRQDQSTT